MRKSGWIGVGVAIAAGALLSIAFPFISREMKRDSCADDGGMWLTAVQRCVCAYSQRGIYEDAPTPAQLAHRAECELKSKPTDWTDE